MTTIIDMTGQRFGRLLVLNRAEKEHRNAWWVCRCDCGKSIVIRGVQLRYTKGPRSCGCANKGSTRHMLTGSIEHRLWLSMKQRCKESSQSSKYYKDSGIKVCERWKKFENFLEDMGERPSDKHEIDRIDNTGDYTKSNCRWVFRFINLRNTRKCMWWWIDGKRYESCHHAATELNVSASTIRYWCQGKKYGDKFYLPKPDCWSELKYPSVGDKV